MNTDRDLRTELTAARAEYRRDLRWLRRRFGITPTPQHYQANPVVLAALDAIEADTPEAIRAAIEAFRNMHRAMMKDTVWDVLEQTKTALEVIRETDPELFADKTATWNQASWLFTNFNTSASRTISGNYRKALNILATL